MDESLSRDALVQRLRELVIALAAYRTDCTRYALRGEEDIADLEQWSHDVSEIAIQHAQNLGIVRLPPQ